MKNNFNKSSKYGIILQSRLNSKPRERLLNHISVTLGKDTDLKQKTKQITILTPNPEIINMSYSDPLLYNILASADILLVDAIGLSQAAFFLNLRAPYRMSYRIPVCIAQGLYTGSLTFFDRSVLEKNC